MIECMDDYIGVVQDFENFIVQKSQIQFRSVFVSNFQWWG